MPIPIPSLDDRRFDDLVREARALIPAGAPEWTNHNASDPGVTLIELFAYITETLLYRLDRVTPDTIFAFLNLLDGGSRTPRNMHDVDLHAHVRRTMRMLRTLERAVTVEDFETLALSPAALPLEEHRHGVARVKCVPRRNLESADPGLDLADHLSVVVLPAKNHGADPADVRQQLFAFLNERRLLGTRLHVVGPSYVDVTVDVTAVTRGDQSDPRLVRLAIVDAISRYLDPHGGGDDGRGWPFGRGVFVSELYALVSRLPAVGFVKTVKLTPALADRLIVSDATKTGQVVGVALLPHELVRATIRLGTVAVVKA